MSPPDSSLPSSVGDLAALAQLRQEHAPKLLAMLRRRIDPALTARIDAEDVLQETFLLAQRKWSDFKAGSPMTPYAWLYRLAYDCLIEAYRKHNRGPRDFHRDMPWPEHSSAQLGLHLVSPGTSPSEAAAREELQQRVRQVLALLKREDQEILWMRHFDDLSYREAADVLDITENAASVRYVRALKRLKKLWQSIHGQE